MYLNGKKGTSVVTFLGEVHELEKQKYQIKSGNKNWKTNAEKLQQYLQDIKYAFNHSNNESASAGELLDKEALNLIINSIKDKKGNLMHLGQRRGRLGGFQFERDLTRIIMATMENVSIEGTKIDKNQILVGKNVGRSRKYWRVFKKMTKRYFGRDRNQDLYRI